MTEPDNDGFWLAASKGQIDIIKSLVSSDHPPDINFVDDSSGMNPLQIACEQGHTKVVEYLINIGADLTYSGERASMAIHYACRSSNESERVAMMQIILNKNSEMINAADKMNRRTCLHLAAIYRDGETVKWLLDKGADPALKDNKDRTAWDWVNKFPNRMDTFAAFVLKEDGNGVANADSDVPGSNSLDPGASLVENPLKAGCKLAQLGANHLYLCDRASRRHVFTHLCWLSVEHESVAQASQYINKELSDFRRTKTGVTYRNSTCVFKDLRPVDHKTIPEMIYPNDTDSKKWRDSAIGDNKTTSRKNVDIQTSTPASSLAALEVVDERTTLGDDSNITERLKAPRQNLSSREGILRSMPDFISLAIPYFTINWSYFGRERDRKGDPAARYCVGNTSDSFGLFESTTLDEYCYPTLPKGALERRNRDQTITRLDIMERKLSLGENPIKKSAWDNAVIQTNVPLITIGQAWVWKTQDVAIFADTERLDGFYPTNFECALGDSLSGVSDGLIGIAILFAKLVDCIELGWDLHESILDVYGTAIIKVAEDVEEYIRKPGVENMGIEKEKGFLHQIGDVREELTMIRRILTQQEEVWGKFASNVWPEIWAKSSEGQKPYYIGSTDFELREKERTLMNTVLQPNLQIQKFRRQVDQLDEDADRVERSVITQLDLKAKYASLRESHATAIMSAAVFGFAVITIIFTPLSFAMSLFALPIQRFQENQIQNHWTDQSGMYVSNYIGKWTGENINVAKTLTLTLVAITEVVSVSLTIAASWMALEFGLEYRVTAMMFCFFIRTSMKLIKKFWITNFIFYRILLLWTQKSKLSSGAQEKYVRRMMNDWQEISLSDKSERRQLKEVNLSERSLRNHLKEISKITEDDMLEEDESGTGEPQSKDGEKPTRRHRWRKWRNVGADEEHGEAEVISRSTET